MRTIEEAISIFEKNETVTEILEIISEQRLPDAWFVAGSVYRNLWNIMCDYPIEFKTDIDVAFYDPNMTYDESETLNKKIREAYPQFDWEIKNEFVMHIRNGYEKKRYSSTEDAVSKFPEVATAIGLRRHHGNIEWLAPYGFNDLRNMIIRPTPTFVGSEDYFIRKRRKKLHDIYPKIKYKDEFVSNKINQQ